MRKIISILMCSIFACTGSLQVYAEEVQEPELTETEVQQIDSDESEETDSFDSSEAIEPEITESEEPAEETAIETDEPVEENTAEEVVIEEIEEPVEVLTAGNAKVSGDIVRKDNSGISLEEPITARLFRMDWKDKNTKNEADMVEVGTCVIPAGTSAFEFTGVEDGDYRISGNTVVGNALFKIAMATPYITVKDGAPVTGLKVSSSWVYNYDNGSRKYTTFQKSKGDEGFELPFESPESFSQIYVYPVGHDSYKGGALKEGFVVDMEKHVIRFTKDFIDALKSGTRYSVAITTSEGVEYLYFSVDEDLNCVFLQEGEKFYWYESGVRQGTYDDPQGVMGDGTIRGREIYDPATNGWYWLDSVYDGAKATGKEVWMPYIYQDEAKWDDAQKAKIAEESDPGMAECVLNAMRKKDGKWVRYDENGKMLKGWVTIEGELANLYPEQAGNRYYYDNRTGLMAKGWVTIGGRRFHFDEETGVLK